MNTGLRARPRFLGGFSARDSSSIHRVPTSLAPRSQVGPRAYGKSLPARLRSTRAVLTTCQEYSGHRVAVATRNGGRKTRRGEGAAGRGHGGSARIRHVKSPRRVLTMANLTPPGPSGPAVSQSEFPHAYTDCSGVGPTRKRVSEACVGWWSGHWPAVAPGLPL